MRLTGLSLVTPNDLGTLPLSIYLEDWTVLHIKKGHQKK